MTEAPASLTNPAEPKPSPVTAEPPVPEDRKRLGYAAKMALGALGVVYGDIGTSPLYSVRECFHGSHSVPISEANVLGVLSLIFWSLTLIVTVKYVFVVLRADNKGEGGILSLMALTLGKVRSSRLQPFVIACGVFGAALLYGDGAITPAISVLSAVEGLEIAVPQLHRWVIPITIAILIGLFSLQRRGTAGIGKVFGPIMLVWFVTLAALGIAHIGDNPGVLRALNPAYGANFLVENGSAALGALGSVMLVVTGGESLYADLGHFGRRPIRSAWFVLVLPALFLNYLGQGAFLLAHPEHAENPFFLMAPGWTLYPLVVLSTAAATIASQALITGVFSLTRQATMLGFLPRMDVLHTSARERGQVYVPSTNWLLMLACVGLVLSFKTSSDLAAAYGIAVIMTMVITTILLAVYARRGWGISLPIVIGLTVLLIVPEGAFLAANFTKFAQGGWFPLAVAASLFTLMTTWRRGRQILAARFREQLLPLSDFLELIRVELPARVPGTAVFMTSASDGTPPALLNNFMHNRVLHQHIVLLTVQTEESARVSEQNRFEVQHLEQGFSRLIGHYGFMERPDAPALLASAGLVTTVAHTTFFLGRENLIATEHPGMARWRVLLFAALTRNAQPANKFFNIPPDRVMELGAQIEL